MTKIPGTIAEKIDAAYKEHFDKEPPRSHLGASIIGHDCERWLWYSFRFIARESFDGRMYRLFERGRDEEKRAINNLRAAGLVIDMIDEGGNQFSFSSSGFGGSCDGIIRSGVPEAPEKPHILEIKTHSKKSFDDLAAKGVAESKPQHFVQMQVYMAAFDIDRAIYYAICKDDDRLHIERIKHDKFVSDWAVERAERIIFRSDELPPRVSDVPTWWQCKFCAAREVCHNKAPAPDNCRTCSLGGMNEKGEWHCSKWNAAVPLEVQLKGCEGHELLDVLIPF